ncbi:MOSC domain-containing protein [Motiliproteus coralliicola]|uniref:MOSC domain-containing protein n=1 Tax=Motiliproteus coralliicola TaxID=2283196 RepID=A0A369WF76_9GAMM|nr:MOSC domain-containing protein [Motiliproteus coralliicola]RDE19953.1 MOSC domain-containing protein [Motiliproteus coralliicola]
MSAQSQLFSRYVTDLPAGELSWIGVRPKRRAPMKSLQHTRAFATLGLEGDHRVEKTPGSARQVTLISEEFIQQISHFLGDRIVRPQQLRRNLVVKNINLNALRYQTFKIGDALFEATALCHPCSRMEQELGEGSFAAMLGHGGLCCKVLQSGIIRLGDAIELCPAKAPST